MKLHVIHVASGREWRGGQNQVRLLARALERDQSLDQTVVTGRDSELARRLQAAHVMVDSTGWSTALDPRVLLTLIRRARRGPAILHAHDAHALTLAGLAARITGAKLVVTRRVDFPLRRHGFWARADRVIAISSAIRNILVKDGLSPGRITVVHSGIDPVEVRSAPQSSIRSQLGLAPNLPLAVNVAALVPHKDHMTLLNAASHLRTRRSDLHWVIVGEGPLRGELSQSIDALGLGDRVHLVGQSSNPWGVIREATVFVMSSKEEGLGTSILDAMALEVPVVATRAGGIPEMLDDGAGVLVPVGDGAGLAEGVDRLLGDAGLREQVRRMATLALPRFSDTAMADGVLTVYRSILPTG